MDRKESPGDRAYQYVRELVGNIGPRPAGSQAERDAFDLITLNLIRAGYETESMPVDFAPSTGFSWVNLSAGMLLGISGLLVYTFPIITLLLPVLMAGLPDLTRWEISKRKRTGRSMNVYAHSAADQNKPTYIFAAHVDSARSLPEGPKAALTLNSNSMMIIQRIAILFAISSIFIMINYSFPNYFRIFLSLLGGISGTGFIILDFWRNSSKGKHSPGAIDNASGVGVLLALAEYFSEGMPKRVNVGFLFTGAEETGLFGARQFAENICSSGRAVYVINIDMVGAGNSIQYVTRDGVFSPAFTSKQINSLLQTLSQQIQPVQYLLQSGDFAAFIREGIPAVSIQTNGSAESRRAYHTIRDTIELVDPLTLDLVTTTMIALVERISYEITG